MDKVDLSNFDFRAFLEERKPDKSFVPDFEQEFPPEYYKMLRTLDEGRQWEGLATAVT